MKRKSLVIYHPHAQIHQPVQDTLSEDRTTLLQVQVTAQLPHFIFWKERKMGRTSFAIHQPHAQIHQEVQTTLPEAEATLLQVQVTVQLPQAVQATLTEAEATLLQVQVIVQLLHFIFWKERKMRRMSLAIHLPHVQVHQAIQATLPEAEATLPEAKATLPEAKATLRQSQVTVQLPHFIFWKERKMGRTSLVFTNLMLKFKKQSKHFCHFFLFSVLFVHK